MAHGDSAVVDAKFYPSCFWSRVRGVPPYLTGRPPSCSHASVAHTTTRPSSQGPASALRFKQLRPCFLSPLAPCRTEGSDLLKNLVTCKNHPSSSTWFRGRSGLGRDRTCAGDMEYVDRRLDVSLHRRGAYARKGGAPVPVWRVKTSPGRYHPWGAVHYYHDAAWCRWHL